MEVVRVARVIQVVSMVSVARLAVRLEGFEAEYGCVVVASGNLVFAILANQPDYWNT